MFSTLRQATITVWTTVEASRLSTFLMTRVTRKTRRQILKVKLKPSGDFLSQDFIESIQHKMLIGLGLVKEEEEKLLEGESGI